MERIVLKVGMQACEHGKRIKLFRMINKENRDLKALVSSLCISTYQRETPLKTLLTERQILIIKALMVLIIKAFLQVYFNHP